MTPLVIGLVLLLPALTLPLPPAAQDPWLKVPAFPTGCYSGRDDFAKSTASALEALSTDGSRQEQINNDLKEQYARLDPEQMQANIQAYKTSHPEEAAKAAQASQAVGVDHQAKARAYRERGQKLEDELRGLLAQYDAALDTSLAPLAAKRKALPVEDGKGLVKQANAEYERVCGEWWSASGPLRAWLKRDREFLQERSAFNEKLEETKAMEFTLAGVSGVAYRSLEGPKAVHDYLKHAAAIFAKRWEQPLDPDHSEIPTLNP